MRNCLPKVSRVFRRKTASKSGQDNATNEPDSDAEPYTAVIRPTTTVTRTTSALSALPADNHNESSHSRLISAAAHLDLDLDLDSESNLDSDGPVAATATRKATSNGGIQGYRAEMKVETISTAPSAAAAPVAISLPFGGRNSGKTPEEMELEYEANVKAEGRDIMTPLRRSTRPLSVAFSGSGRTALQAEIVEVIRSLDVPALLLNNLTLDTNRECAGVGPDELEKPEADHDHEESVVLRRKVNCLERKTRSLYERRLPKVPKLHLQVAEKKNAVQVLQEQERERERVEEEEFRIFQRNLMDLKYPTVLPPNPQLKALLVFHKADSICEAISAACQRHQLDVTLVKSKEEALDTLQKSYATAQCYHLIIIDARSSKNLDAEHIARTIRHTHGHHLTTIIAVCKKSFFEKDDVLIALLDAGVNRCVAETTNLAMCSVELKQILHSIIRPHNVMSTQQALYTALHRLKEVVLITDDVLRIQYANRATERLLNMRLDEIISKPLADIFVSDLTTISEQGKSIKEFDGILTVRRKNQEGIPMHVRVVPVACIGSAPTHLIFNFDVPGGQMDFIATLPQPKEAPRGSLHSVRRCSFDVRSIASDGLRRTSLAKLTSLPLEAPITKIINLLSQVQENCSADEARLIDKVLEFLKREGLYSPQMKEIRTDDPIATDLIGALLTGPSVYSSRRSSNDSIIRTGSSTRAATIVPAKMKVNSPNLLPIIYPTTTGFYVFVQANPIIMELLDESLNWDFDIFKLEEITDYHPLLYLGMEMFRRFDVFATLNIDENVCKAWLAVIEAHYHKSNTYHNSTHAADVMQATGAFITQLTNKDMMVMDRMEEATALIAAAAHDVDHPGRSSAFLCNSNDSLAVLYNDLTVLENHHAAITFKLTLGDDKINIFKNLDKEQYKSARSTIIDMILATEMTRHFEHLAKFVSVFGGEEPREQHTQTEEETSILMRRMLIKVADVSNPARPMQYCIEWARRIAEEYFMQTDEEKQRHLPIVMPMFDRATCSIPKSQIGFIEYIIQDMMHAWESFIDMPQLITCMQINYSQWKKYDEQGVNTLADIMAKQPPVGKMANSK
ncbi:hypothetical protein KR018_001864 [Drosophila ironensis]|nr:hypothetical protein KR018_001864 [Drosophila ironensis]